MLLTINKKTRKAGIAVLITYIGVLLLGQGVLKHLITRQRPCQIDQDFALLISRPSSSSFPSTHTGWSFGAATAILLNHKKGGIIACVAAFVIAFSRLYLFMHFPTDVLAGMFIGIIMGIIANKMTQKV